MQDWEEDEGSVDLDSKTEQSSTSGEESGGSDAEQEIEGDFE
jgi:hypothetical protein